MLRLVWLVRMVLLDLVVLREGTLAVREAAMEEETEAMEETVVMGVCLVVVVVIQDKMVLEILEAPVLLAVLDQVELLVQPLV